ncbi:MAG: cryptochrome/photolyase family protein [Bacteroidota bacterium]
MNQATIIFPHQLFPHHPSLHKKVPVYLIEEFLFFRQYPFHKKKIMLHRASMKHYANLLEKQGYKVEYINSQSAESDIRVLIKILAAEKVRELLYTDPADNWLEKRMVAAAGKYKMMLQKSDSPNFLNTLEETNEFFKGRKTYFQTDFYVWQRKQRKILVDEQLKPIGGKWTFDADNRKAFPKGETIPSITFPKEDDLIDEARSYAEIYFKNNYGSTENFIYPVTHNDAEKWLQEFLDRRFEKFGIYEDAMVANESFLYHSVLSPLINIGLLSPQQVVAAALKTGDKKNIPLNSLEGFIRQLIGWREFIRLVYEREGTKQRTTNYWGFKRKIPESFWNGTTGIEPIDIVIQKTLKTGYCHHIERLMVLGNFMQLCEFDPDEVYKWFMELFIDAYDWVMVPNVYGMTQFADGGLMTTKPYISGSNYLLKMGDWKKGEWTTIWDGLFWRFMHEHRSFFSQNPRLGMLLKTFDKMPKEKQAAHLNAANQFLKKLDQHVHP